MSINNLTADDNPPRDHQKIQAQWKASAIFDLPEVQIQIVSPITGNKIEEKGNAFWKRSLIDS